MPALDLALGHRMIRCATDVLHVLAVEPFRLVRRDVAKNSAARAALETSRPKGCPKDLGIPRGRLGQAAFVTKPKFDQRNKVRLNQSDRTPSASLRDRPWPNSRLDKPSDRLNNLIVSVVLGVKKLDHAGKFTHADINHRAQPIYFELKLF
jgi:hypothetical protein